MTVLKDMNQSDRKHTETDDVPEAEKTAQMISSQDIRAVAISAEPKEERLAALKSMKADLEARQSDGSDSELGPLIEEVDKAIENLSTAGDQGG